MLKRQLEQLEKGSECQALVVIVDCYIGPSGWFEPVLGYQIGDSPMYKKAEEPYEELEARAELAIRAQAPKDARVLILEPIGREEPCEA